MPKESAKRADQIGTTVFMPKEWWIRGIKVAGAMQARDGEKVTVRDLHVKLFKAGVERLEKELGLPGKKASE